MATETGTITVGGIVHGALVTSTEYNDFLGSTAPNSTQVQAAIYDATAFITKDLNRIFVREDDAFSILEMFSGHGLHDYYPIQGPIVTVGVIEYYDGANWTVADTTIYSPETNGNKIFFRDGQVFWKELPQRVIVSYL